MCSRVIWPFWKTSQLPSLPCGSVLDKNAQPLILGPRQGLGLLLGLLYIGMTVSKPLLCNRVHNVPETALTFWQM